MAINMQISKSDYMLFLKHPAWIWLKKHDKSKLPPVDENLQAIFDAGNMFEAYAEKLFPSGLHLGFDNYNEYLTLPEATQKAIADGNKVIFQGRFEYEQLTFICDIVEIVGTKELDLYEIKSSTSAKVDHLHDLAFQMIVLEGCGYSVRNIAVIHVNKEYVRHGAVEPKDITATTYVTNKVKAMRAQTQAQIKAALAVVNSPTIPDISPAHVGLGAFAEWLEIYRSLAKPEPYSIYDLCSPGAERIGKLESRGIKQLADIPSDFDLNAKQALQVQVTKANAEIVNRDKIDTFIKELKYPLYFLDYETLMSVVPYFDGIRPYQQLPFQYSLHVLDSPDAELRHTEYLHRDNSNPAEPLARQLLADIGTSGSVLVWYENFEKSRNTELGDLLPQYREVFANLNARVVDLMLPFANGWYAHKDFFGSASIKKVLPVLVPKLSYKVLGIQEGGAAQRLWMEAVLDGKRASEREQILADLVDYCGLDTLAMVEIFKFLLKPGALKTETEAWPKLRSNTPIGENLSLDL